MRELTGHKVNPVNDVLKVLVLDEPGHGGACHRYSITNDGPTELADVSTAIHFQDGPINEAGINGITHEALLAILIDRLQGFQSGPYAGRENAIALTHLQDAQHWLQHRTRERMARGVEGTHAK
jgi:hypothetical protein